jgi:phage gpG-like protein
MIAITVDDAQITAALNRLAERAGNLKPAWHDIGEHLTETTKRRFATSTAPNGAPWAPNRPSTLLAYLGSRSGVWNHKGQRVGNKKGYFRQDGRLGAKGAEAMMGKKPLIGESKSLSTTINYRVIDNGVEIGSPMIYAAVQQFGARRHQFGKAPWGDIPARPFLGLSADDTQAVISIVSAYLAQL